MPTWISIILGIISGVGTLGGILGISTYIQERARAKAQEKNDEEKKQKEEIEQAKHQCQIGEIKTILTQELTPIREDISVIKKEIELNRMATVTSLRAIMKQLRDQYKQQGYADAGDTATWNELYENYRINGGNHFKEYVNQWKEEVGNLPLELPNKEKTE